MYVCMLDLHSMGRCDLQSGLCMCFGILGLGIWCAQLQLSGAHSQQSQHKYMKVGRAAKALPEAVKLVG